MATIETIAENMPDGANDDAKVKVRMSNSLNSKKFPLFKIRRRRGIGLENYHPWLGSIQNATTLLPRFLSDVLTNQ